MATYEGQIISWPPALAGMLGTYTPTIYAMRARRISTGALVYWERYEQADPTGAYSGIDPTDLADIVVLSTRVSE